MSTPIHVQRMREALSTAHLSVEEVWVSYYGMGGAVARFEIEAYLGGLLILPADECDCSPMQRTIYPHAPRSVYRSLDASPLSRPGRHRILAEPSGQRVLSC